jgi:surface polysaccharide O-acyltransferase-like enzyme
MQRQKFGVSRYILKQLIIIIIIIIIIFRDLFPTEQHTPSLLVMATNRLIFYETVCAFYSEDNAKHGNSLMEGKYCV